jgi:tRNA-dihydrouridine synthase
MSDLLGRDMGNTNVLDSIEDGSEFPSKLSQLCESPILLAPMVGLSHYAVRRALADFLPPNQKALWYTEMLSSRRLPNEKENGCPELLFLDRDHGLCPQLLGNDAYFISESIRRLEDWGASAIDINMGCPVQKALKHNYGVSLMGDISYAARVAAMAVKVSRLPVSVKLRAGLQSDRDFLLRFALALESEGVSWLTLHPRTADQKRRGLADWTQIKMLKENLKIPVIGNGDIQNSEDVARMRSETNCDRVMIGRALLAKPGLLGGTQSSEPDNYRSFLLKVIHYSEAYENESVSLRKIKFLLYHSSVWLEFGHSLYSEMTRVKSLEGARKLVEHFFERAPRKISRETSLMR